MEPVHTSVSSQPPSGSWRGRDLAQTLLVHCKTTTLGRKFPSPQRVTGVLAPALLAEGYEQLFTSWSIRKHQHKPRDLTAEEKFEAVKEENLLQPS